MSAATAMAAGAPGRLGMMVRTGTQMVLYWSPRTDAPLRIQVIDLTGRVPAESLDGTGRRELPADRPVIYLDRLLPGHLYGVAVGHGEGDRFVPLLRAGPVQTPWRPRPDTSTFPAKYHRS